MRVLDIFCGAGGFSLGFARNHFSVTGVDNNPWAGEVFKQNNIGSFIEKDLREESIHTECTILSGGPPCRPWSALNLTRRKEKHPDYSHLEKYFQHVLDLKPEVFLMENVINLSSDDLLQRMLQSIHKEKYYADCRIVRYSDWGAATKRRRLLIVGFRGNPLGPGEFFERLNLRKTDPTTVGHAILKYEKAGRGELPDHEWPRG